MKWITEISIDNYRAFIQKMHIAIPFGNHSLIYGENGSGKTSLYYALRDFFNSIEEPYLEYELNHFARKNGRKEGAIELTISTKNESGNIFPNPSKYIYSNDPKSSTNVVPELRQANKIKGFLDYKKLLEIHALKTPKGNSHNLFSLLIENLLAEHKIASSEGGVRTNPLYKSYKKCKEVLLQNVPEYSFSEKSEVEGRILEIQGIIGKMFEEPVPELTPQETASEIDALEQEAKLAQKVLQHQNAIKELEFLSKQIFNLLKDCFELTGTYLKKYFNAQIEVDLSISKLKYDEKNNNIDERIGLRVKYAGEEIPDYHLFLNEARLSAIAICVFLSAIKKYPSDDKDLRVIYLDDIFIGLDTNNRMPLLELLYEEFIKEGYQIIISTYDKHWYERAKRFFDGRMKDKLTCYEFYITKNELGGKFLDCPLIIKNDNDYSKAVKYLHSQTTPDYPAAANYFRKHAEKILSDYIPSHELRYVEDNSAIETYKLGKIIEKAILFMQKIKTDVSLLNKLEQNLPTLLHPLSHYDLSSPTYKEELLDVERIIFELEKQLGSLKGHYKLLIPSQRMIKLKFEITSIKTGYYLIEIIEPIYLIKNDPDILILSNGKCRCLSTFITENGVKVNNIKLPSTKDNFKYESIENAYESIYTHNSANSDYSHIPHSSNYLDEFELLNNVSPTKLSDMIVW